MFDQNIVSKKYSDFNSINQEINKNYINANPFPNIVLEKFF